MRRYLVAISGIFLAALAAAQTARQGTPEEVPDAANSFHSPMILETSFAPADRSLWVSDEWTPSDRRPWKSGTFTTAEYYALGKFSCDGLFFRNGNRHGPWNTGLLMKVKPKGATTEVTMIAEVTNPGNVHDKTVTLLFEVLNGEEIVKTATIKIKANRNWRGKMQDYDGETTFTVPTAALTKDPVTKMRITMTTQDY